MGLERTAVALEADLAHWYGVDLLDFYRGTLTYRRLCALVTHLPEDAAVWQAFTADARWTRADVLLWTIERRLTALWATVSTAFGATVEDEHLAPPLPMGESTQDSPPADEPPVLSMREIAIMMRS